MPSPENVSRSAGNVQALRPPLAACLASFRDDGMQRAITSEESPGIDAALSEKTFLLI
jgi:hypothetical protein